MSRKLDEARKAYNEAARRNGRPELSEEQGPSVAPQSIPRDAPRDLIKNPYPQVNLDAQPQAISTPAPAAPSAAQSPAPAPASLASTAPASPKMSAAAREYAAAHAAAAARGADVSAMATPDPISEEPDAPPPPPPESNLVDGGRVNTTQGDDIPSWTSRAMYQNFSNDKDAGLAALQGANPELDIRHYRDSVGDKVISRKKLPQGQTSSSEPWSPMDPYGNIAHPIDYLKKFGWGAPKELAQDVLDEAYTVGSGFAQNAATVAGGLGGIGAGMGAASIPAGMLGASTASAASGLTLNALKQAIGSASGYGSRSDTELLLSTILSGAAPSILGTGASKQAIESFIAKKLEALKTGSPEAWDFVNKALTKAVQPGVPEITKEAIERQTGPALAAFANPEEAVGPALEQVKQRLAGAAAVNPHVGNITRVISDQQKGAFRNVWDKISPGAAAASPEFYSWLQEKVPYKMVKELTEAAGIVITDVKGLTRRKLAQYLKGRDMNTPLVEAAETAAKDISTGMSQRYTAGLAQVEDQDWGAALNRFIAATATPEITTDINNEVRDKVLKLAESALVLRDTHKIPLPSPTQPLGKILDALEGMLNDPKVKSSTDDFHDTIKSFVAREMDKFPHDAGENHLVLWENVLDSYKSFIKRWLPDPTKDHTIANREVYDIANELGEKHLRVKGPDYSVGAPQIKQHGPADQLFEGIKNVQKLVTDSMRATPGALGDMARKIDAFAENEKARLYKLIPDQGLKADYKASLRIIDRLKAAFSDPATAARSMRQAELPASENGGFSSFLDEVDTLLRDADRAAGRGERVTFGDYAKNAAISNFFANDKTPPLLSPQAINSPLRAVIRPQYAPESAVKSIWSLRHPRAVEWWMNRKEGPVLRGGGKIVHSLNLFNRLPEKAQPNRWHLLNSAIDNNDDYMNRDSNKKKEK